MFLWLFITNLLFGISMGSFNPIAFTISLSSTWTVLNETTVPYGHTITNHMQRPEVSHGIFTSKEGGTYKCQAYALSDKSSKIFLDIWHNNDRIASIYGHIRNSLGTGGNAVVLRLAEGDTVQVKSRLNTHVRLYGSPSRIYSTFTCVQIGSREIYDDQEHVPAFSVLANRNQLAQGGESIMYNNKLIDQGNAFNLETGVYKAPSAGIYIFHFFSLAQQNEELWQDLFLNARYICSIKFLANFDWAQDGNAVILHLNASDKVTVKAHFGSDNNLLGRYDQIYTTFSGVQVISDLDIASPDSFPVVAFSVGLTYNISSLPVGSAIPFDKVFVNYKNAYDVSKNHFVAPASGLYEFNYHIRSFKSDFIYVELIVNSRYINSVNSMATGRFSTAGNAAVLELKGGDIVTVRNQYISTSLYGDLNEIYCTFSGYLLHSILPDEIVG